MDAKHYADQLAVCAVTGNKTELVKVAAEYTKSAAFDLSQLGSQISGGLQNAWNTPALRNAMIGMGAGGLVGMLQPKRKFRNALQYGLLGGLSGLGYSAISGDLNKLIDPKKDAAPPAAPGAAPAADAAAPASSALIPGLPNRPYTAAEQHAINATKPSPLGGAATVGTLTGAAAGAGAGNLGARFLESRLQHNVTNLANDAKSTVGRELAKLRQYAPAGRTTSAPARPGAAQNAINFVDDFKSDPATGMNNRFLRAGINSEEAARRAINNAAEVINNGRLPMNPMRTRQVLEDTVRVINADNPKANMTVEQLQQALRGTQRMPWLRRIGTIGGGLGGAFFGGSAGANWDASRRNAEAAKAMMLQSGVR